MNWSDEVHPTHATSTVPMPHFQAYIKRESATNQGDASVTPFHTMDDEFSTNTSASLCHVKTEPVESEDKEDCELINTMDYSFDVHIKQETVERHMTDDYAMQGEVNQLNTSDNEDDEVVNDHKNTFSDLATVKPTMNENIPQNVPNAGDISAMERESDATGEMIKQKHCSRVGNRKQIFQKRMKRLCYINGTNCTCAVCGKVFSRSQACLWHIWQTHTREKSYPYACKLNKKTFKCPNDLKYHKISRSNGRPHFCDLCGKTFTQKDHLQQHKASCHSNARPYPCHLYGKTFLQKYNVLKHKAACHLNERPHCCDLCEKTFKSKSHLHQHKAVCHSNESPYYCDFCNKAFTQEYSLHQHKSACHSNEKPNFCDFCDKTFAEKYSLHQHKAACHSNERSYSCDLRGKTFTQKGSVEQRKVLCHSNERPYFRYLSEKTFKIKSHLQKRKAACDLKQMEFHNFRQIKMINGVPSVSIQTHFRYGS